MAFAAPALAVLLPLAAAAPTSAPVRPEQKELLRRADVAADAPATFRARLEIRAAADARPTAVEIWCSGEDHTLVRFLDLRERGKYLVYDRERVYFIAPAARKPVKLPRSFRLRGSASLDDVLGLRYSRDFTILEAREQRGPEGARVVFDLEDRRPGASYPRVLYTVDAVRARPLRAEMRLRSGKLASTIEFKEWAGGARLCPATLLLSDMLRGGALTEVRVTSLEPRPVPAGLFDLKDATARRALEADLEPDRP